MIAHVTENTVKLKLVGNYPWTLEMSRVDQSIKSMQSGFHERMK